MKSSIFKTMFLVVFGAAIVIGIFVFATHTSNKSTSPTTVGSVLIWGTLPKASVMAAITAGIQINNQLKNVTYVEKNEATLATDLASAIATGASPDLVLASQEDLHALSKLITPIPTASLSAATFNATFVEEARLLSVADGSGYYGVPLFVDPLVLYSNHAILSSAGIAKPPETWEALTGLAPNVANLTPTKQVTRGLIALGTYDNVHNARGILSALLLQMGVGMSSMASGNLVANLSGYSTAGVLPGRAVLDFYTQFADPSKVSYTWNASLPDSQKSFLNGDLALYIGYASEAQFMKVANPNLDFDVSMLPQPATATVKSTYGLVYSLMIPRGAKNASGAFQAMLLFSSSAISAATSAATGLAPANLTELATAQTDPVAAIAYPEALYAEGWLSPMPADTDSIFSSMINDVISGRLTTDTALTTSSNALTSLLQK